MLPSKYYSSFSFGYKSSSKIETLTPGPGTYHPFKEEEKKYENPKNETVLPKIQSENLAQTKISSENSQKLKKLFTNKTKQSNGFSISKREDLYNKENKKTPGPGAYQINYRASFNDAPGYKYSFH